MTDWILVETEGGSTRINMGAISAYQVPKSGDSLLIYTNDSSLFEVEEKYQEVVKRLDLYFETIDS